MVYRIRNKSLYYTIDGFKNTYFSKVLHNSGNLDPTLTTCLNLPIDYLSFIRTI